jgi:hypothetical protein
MLLLQIKIKLCRARKYLLTIVKRCFEAEMISHYKKKQTTFGRRCFFKKEFTRNKVRFS